MMAAPNADPGRCDAMQRVCRPQCQCQDEQYGQAAFVFAHRRVAFRIVSARRIAAEHQHDQQDDHQEGQQPGDRHVEQEELAVAQRHAVDALDQSAHHHVRYRRRQQAHRRHYRAEGGSEDHAVTAAAAGLVSHTVGQGGDDRHQQDDAAHRRRHNEGKAEGSQRDAQQHTPVGMPRPLQHRLGHANAETGSLHGDAKYDTAEDQPHRACMESGKHDGGFGDMQHHGEQEEQKAGDMRRQHFGRPEGNGDKHQAERLQSVGLDTVRRRQDQERRADGDHESGDQFCEERGPVGRAFPMDCAHGVKSRESGL